jgi:hypothetical protein
MRPRWLFSALLAFGIALAQPALAQADARQAHVELIREKLALHVGTLAYLWGYPMVDMARQMHNETHRVAPGQRVAAPVNHFHRHEALVTPRTAGELRAPNNDTLYFGGWFDLSVEPVIVQAPDTAGRYYTLALTDFFNEVTHLGRRTTGTGARVFALVGPGWQGTLPDGVTPVRLATRQVWILGRLLVDGEADFPAAIALVRGFWSAPLSTWQRDRPPPVPAVREAARADPMESLDYFAWLNRWLQGNAAREDEAALMGLFDQIGIGPRATFDPARIDDATRRGLEAAVAEGRALLRASSRRPLPDVRNGWIFPLALADYGHDYLMRASVAFGGYANRPEETVYAARTVDADGRPLSGQRRYRLRFAPGTTPPVDAFWSISAYDLATFSLIENPLRRYSIGDRTAGLRRASDGSIEIDISRDPPPEGTANWLPVGDGEFSLVVRMYQPARSVFDGRYALPPLQERH